MSYRIIARPDYFYPVRVAVLAEENGAVLEHTFDAQFKRFSQQEIDDIKANIKTDADIVRKAMIGWRGVEGADGSPLPFNAENLDRLLADNGMAFALCKAWYESLTKELVKN